MSVAVEKCLKKHKAAVPQVSFCMKCRLSVLVKRCDKEKTMLPNICSLMFNAGLL